MKAGGKKQNILENQVYIHITMKNTIKKTYRIGHERIKQLIQTILVGLLSAFALFLGQYFIYHISELLYASILCFIIFIILAIVYLFEPFYGL